MGAWAADCGIDLAAFDAVLREWLGADAAALAEVNPVHALERGEMEVPLFEQRLAEAMQARSRCEVEPAGLLNRMFDYFEHAPDMAGLVRRARAGGLRTALLSNSWGNAYPREGWASMFDAVVISGEVGMRKPEPRIYRHTCDLLGLEPHECVFVDDLPSNVRAAVDLGMVGVHHVSYDATAPELEVLFGRRLRG